MRLQLANPSLHPRVASLPFSTDLEEWDLPDLHGVLGLHRHVVRLVELGEVSYVVKQLPDALALMSRAVGLDFASFSSISPVAPENAVLLEHGRPPLEPADRAEWERLLGTHPYAAHIATAADPRPRLTDVVDLREFAATEVYQVCLEPFGARYQAGLRVWRSSDTFSLVSLWRADRDFTDEELRPALLFADALRVSWRLRTALLQLSAEVAAAQRSGGQGLTQRQTEVVSLIARGLTNQQIATRLGISTRTTVPMFELSMSSGRDFLRNWMRSPACKKTPLAKIFRSASTVPAAIRAACAARFMAVTSALVEASRKTASGVSIPPSFCHCSRSLAIAWGRSSARWKHLFLMNSLKASLGSPRSKAATAQTEGAACPRWRAGADRPQR